MTPPRLTLRIDLPNGSRLGPGKIALLEAIAERKSIAGAARDHDMSYRRAWLLIDDMNRAFAQPVVETFPGRSQGTGAELSSFGEKLVALYRAAETQARNASLQALAELSEGCNESYSAGELKRSRRKKAARGV